MSCIQSGRWLYAAGLLLLACRSQPPEGTRPRPPRTAAPGDFAPPDVPFDAPFFIHALGNRCVDFGGQAYWAVGAPVFIYPCNGSVAQQVRVREIDASHDVELRVQSAFCIGVRGGAVAPSAVMELQTCNGSPAQRFALDGDAILLGSQATGRVTREYALLPDRAITLPRTPLVVGAWEVSDAEFFRFEAVDKGAARPTSGFVRVASEPWLDWALGLGWGTVIELDPPDGLVLFGAASKSVPTGFTIRGDRKFTLQGPEVVRCVGPEGTAAFELGENDVRLTGFRLRGPTNDPRCRTAPKGETSGILVGLGADRHIRLDHLDVSRFTGSSADIRGQVPFDTLNCPAGVVGYPREPRVRVISNFFHHAGAYGTVTGGGAFIQVRANVYYGQRAHSLASDGNAMSGYLATDNIVMSPPSGGHDFDAHGTFNGKESHWYDGLSGDYFDIGWNTFLQTDEVNINQRGTPCRFMAIHNNVFKQSRDDAVTTLSKDLTKHVVWDNAFDQDPTTELGVGDFDGDGLSDLFMGTGAVWYFSSGAKAEWRYLNRMPEHARQLRFGDLDGDGRTDVIALHNGTIDVSWAGGSPWQSINVTAWALSDLAVGDFDGDHRDDLFLAMGTQWFFAPGGRNWTPFAVSGFRTADLRFGDFTKDGKTDVLGLVGGQWQVVPGGEESWKPLNAPISGPMSGLVVGDFDGDGRADVARDFVAQGHIIWRFSSGAAGPWAGLRVASRPLASLPTGRFDGNASTDVIEWKDDKFAMAPSGHDPVQTLSRQVMR